MSNENGTTNSRKVFVKVNFLKVTDIDTLKEVFHADIFVQTRWREPSLDSAQETKRIDTSKYWNPKIIITNSAPSVDCRVWASVSQNTVGEAYIVEKRRLKGVFSENLELHEFPFDVQDLSVVVSSEHEDDLIEIVEDEEEISAVNVMCFVDETEWHIRDLVYTEPRVFNKEISDTQFKNPALLVKCVATRRAGFFLYNIIMIMTMISSLSLTTFGVNTVKIENRLQLGFIITLTGVTFKMVSTSSLPKIPYLTHLDRFIIGNMSFNWLVCVWHGILSQLQERDNIAEIDSYAFYTLTAVFVLFQLIIWIIIIARRAKRLYAVDIIEKAYQEKALSLMGSSWKNDRRARKMRLNMRNKIDAAGTFAV
ncbi:uncharacterized protein LOC128222184 isoform X2 [Mya arenaria]|uniref:uncharacterized protein LOC128222184 isoform X2 n=1 Tax=Mya arenaria TaxID=6604 RepID=UPI0022E85A6E|nr:uncharacterized protein LOC128222184 isoform X2 [Mya arenaria]